MKRYHFYHRETGIFTGSVLTTTDVAHVVPNTPHDHMAYEGTVDICKQRIDVVTGKLIAHVWEPAALPNMVHAGHARISHLEQNVQPRIIRECWLGYDGAVDRLKKLDDEIITLRKTLKD